MRTLPVFPAAQNCRVIISSFIVFRSCVNSHHYQKNMFPIFLPFPCDSLPIHVCSYFQSLFLCFLYSYSGIHNQFIAMPTKTKKSPTNNLSKSPHKLGNTNYILSTNPTPSSTPPTSLTNPKNSPANQSIRKKKKSSKRSAQRTNPNLPPINATSTSQTNPTHSPANQTQYSLTNPSPTKKKKPPNVLLCVRTQSRLLTQFRQPTQPRQSQSLIILAMISRLIPLFHPPTKLPKDVFFPLTPPTK